MYRITDDQIDFILDDISARGVKMEDLQQSILDHVCCIIEKELEANGDFEAFYHRTIETFYTKELGEIEKETILLLTFKNYYAMKKVMILSGIASVMAFVFGCIFKIFFLPGAGALLFLGIGIMSLVFLPLLFIMKSKEMGTMGNKLVLALGTLCGILYSIGVLFLVLRWPYAPIVWRTALFLSFFVFIPVYFFTGIRKPEGKVNTIITSVLLVAMVGLQITLTALRPNPSMYSKTYLYVQGEEILSLMDKKQENEQAEKIQGTCEEIKKMILQTEIGQGTMPADFEAQNMLMTESRAKNNIFNETAGAALLAKLRKEVAEYNTAYPANKIPTQYTILDPQFARKDFCGNLFVINNITQLQMLVTCTGRGQGLASVR